MPTITDFVNDILSTPWWEYLAIGLFGILGLTVHEVSHGFVALLFGDDTARNAGRLTLNPFAHLDLAGTVFLVIAHFGWAKPVPVDYGKLKMRRLGVMAVAAAGPVSNLLQALLYTGICRFFFVQANWPLLNFFLFGIYINVAVAIFNLLPLPPLDGSKILASFLPDNLERAFYRYQSYFSLIVIFLMLTGLTRYIITQPVNDAVNYLLRIITGG